MNQDQVAQRRSFERTYGILVDGAECCVRSVFIPAMRVITLASELLIDPATPNTATFSIAIRQNGNGRVFLIALGTEVIIEEQGQKPINFVLDSDALAYLQAAIMALGSKRPETWHT
jgi:hypothetical protein